MIALAKKGKGIERLIELLTPAVIEETKQTSAPQHPLTPLLEKYAQIAQQCATAAKNVWPPNVINSVYGFIHDQVNEILIPSDIDLFLQASLPYADHQYYHHTMGFFINQLLLNAIREGYTSFTLHTQNCGPLNFVGQYLHGSAEWRIQLAVKGDLGIECGTWMEYVDVDVSGTVNSSLANNSKHCRFSFLDILDEREGWPCRDNYSRLLNGFGTCEIYSGRDAEGCTFMARQRGCAEMLAGLLPPGNKVVYRADDKDFVLRDFEHEPPQ